LDVPFFDGRKAFILFPFFVVLFYSNTICPLMDIYLKIFNLSYIRIM
jgi:hypothetical protein